MTEFSIIIFFYKKPHQTENKTALQHKNIDIISFANLFDAENDWIYENWITKKKDKKTIIKKLAD